MNTYIYIYIYTYIQLKVQAIYKVGCMVTAMPKWVAMLVGRVVKLEYNLSGLIQCEGELIFFATGSQFVKIKDRVSFSIGPNGDAMDVQLVPEEA